MSDPAVAVTGRVPGALLLDGKYRLEAPIAVGGMGSVWRATHTTLDRPVAVKFADVDRANATVVERFLREAKTAAAIRHPNVIDILDFGRTPEGEAFMVMELLEGRSLDQRLGDDAPLATLAVVEIAGQILSGLEAVHRAGIVHRDLKPGNVFLSEAHGELFARLLDFGISYSLDPESALRRGRFGTEDRLVVGTPEFMAPEQAEGRPDVDARADVYSVAVILYEALSGTLPYTAEHAGQVLYKVIQGECVPLGHLRPDIPEVATVVERAMHRDRAERPASARDFRRQLFSAAGVSGEITGRFHLQRSSGVDLRVSRPISDPPGMAGPRSSHPPARRDDPLREATTASLGIARGPGSVPPAASPSTPPLASAARTIGLAALGSIVALGVAGAAWALFGAQPAPGAASASRPAAERAAEVAPTVAAPVLAAPAVPVAPVAPAAADVVAPPTAVVPSDAVEPAPVAPSGARRPARARTGAARGDEAAPERPSGVVRELDF